MAGELFGVELGEREERTISVGGAWECNAGSARVALRRRSGDETGLWRASAGSKYDEGWSDGVIVTGILDGCVCWRARTGKLVWLFEARSDNRSGRVEGRGMSSAYNVKRCPRMTLGVRCRLVILGDPSLRCLETLRENGRSMSGSAFPQRRASIYITFVCDENDTGNVATLSATPHETFHRRARRGLRATSHWSTSRILRRNGAWPGRGYSDFTHRRPRPAVLPRPQTAPILTDAGRGATPSR